MPISLIVAGIAAIAFAGLGAYAKIEHSGKLEAQAQVAERDAKIDAQNAAVRAAKDEGDRRVAAASKGAQAARKATLALAADRDRLLAAAYAKDGKTTPTPAGACPEHIAAEVIRAGLK